MKKVIITGATGFVGANLARRLLKEGHEVHVLLREGYKNWRIADLIPHLNLHLVNLFDFQKLAKLIKKISPDWIFHLAVHGAYSYQNDIFDILNTNIWGTVNLLEACLRNGFESFVNTGSSSEYGFKDHPPKESDWLDPNSYYAVAKSSATLYCRFSGQKHQLSISTLRLFSVYGPFEEPTRLMPTLIVKGLNKELPPLVNPNVARDLVYVDDAIDAYLLTAQKIPHQFGAVYNVGSGIQTTVAEIVNTTRKIFKIKADPQWNSMPNRSWDTNFWVADNESIKAELGWEPKFSFELGFKKMVSWYQATHELQNRYQEQIIV